MNFILTFPQRETGKLYPAIVEALLETCAFDSEWNGSQGIADYAVMIRPGLRNLGFLSEIWRNIVIVIYGVLKGNNYKSQCNVSVCNLMLKLNDLPNDFLMRIDIKLMIIWLLSQLISTYWYNHFTNNRNGHLTVQSSWNIYGTGNHKWSPARVLFSHGQGSKVS